MGESIDAINNIADTNSGIKSAMSLYSNNQKQNTKIAKIFKNKTKNFFILIIIKSTNFHIMIFIFTPHAIIFYTSFFTDFY